MLFNSLQFAVFFPLTLALFHWLISRKSQQAGVYWLLLASCYFYAAFVPKYLLILFAVILIDYAAGLGLEKTEGQKRKWLLIASLITNLGILFYFKYFNFVMGAAQDFMSLFAGPSSFFQKLQVILPIGLSFHVFQSLSYTIEVYRKRQVAERNLPIYALYVLYFPQLVAGPIERPQNLLHQFHALQPVAFKNIKAGLPLVITGLLRKCVVADNLSFVVDLVYDHPKDFGAAAVWLATLFFAIQIYCDFSGYSNIARGCSKMLGVDLMVNFNRPYFALSLREFWQRWHISLSTWFRDYVYIPLGGNRVSPSRQMWNVFVVFLLSGVWHGASWTFVAWGALHGIGLSLAEIWRRRPAFLTGFSLGALSPFFSWTLTFVFVLISWVLFRAHSMHDALTLFQGMRQQPSLGWASLPAPRLIECGLLVLLLFAAEAFDHYRLRSLWSVLEVQDYRLQSACIGILLLMIFVFGQFSSQSFIYFQF